MKNFELTPAMLTMSGVFYPKGYVFIMFANAGDAEQVARELDSKPDEHYAVMLLSSATVLRDIAKVEGASDVTLPSMGTEAATVRKYVDLARQGHCALMVKVGSDKDTERVVAAARKVGFSYGQRYHLLAMEDLE